MPDVDLRKMIGPLGRRLVSRQQRLSKATGLGLARSVADRRQPRALQAATRLAVGRTIVPREVAPPPPVDAQQAAPLPDYISPFAATVLFGEDATVDSEQATRYAAYQEREEARMEALRSGAVPRGLVHEGPASYEAGNGGTPEGGQFRLSPRLPTSPRVAETKPAEAGAKPGAAQPTADRQSSPVQRLSRATRPEPPKPAPERVRPSEPALEAAPPAAAPDEAPTPEPDETAAPPETAALDRPAPVVPTRVAAERDPEAAEAPGPAPVPVQRVEQPPVDPAEPDSPAAVVPELLPAPEDAVSEPPRGRSAPAPLETPPAGTISTTQTPATPPAVEPTPEPPRPAASETPEPPRAERQPARPASGAPRPDSARPSEAPAAAAAGPAQPASPVRVQRIARTEAKPARPVLARRAAPPPPVVEVPVPTFEVEPYVEAPADVAPPPRTLFRRLADVFRGPRRVEAPELPAEEPATAPEAVAMDVVPAARVQRRTAPPAQPAESVPAETPGPEVAPGAEPVVEPRRGLRAAVARVLRQPVGTSLPSGLGPSPVPGPSGGRTDTTRTPSTPSPGPPTPSGTGGGAGGGGTPSPDGGGGGGAGGGDSSQVGGSQTVQANSVTMGATTVGGSQSVSSGSTTTMGPASVGAAQTITSGAATTMGSAEAGGNQSVQSGGAAITGPMTAGGSQTILTGGLMNVKGGVSGGGAMSVTAGMVRASGPVSAGGPMAFGGAVKATTVAAGTIIGNVTGGTVINMGGGGAGGGAGGPVSRMAADRPKPVPVQNIRVGSAPASIARTPQPTRELPSAPASARTSGAALAAATGAPVQRTPAGDAAVSFPPPRELPIQALPEPIIQRATETTEAPRPAPSPSGGGGSGKDSGADIQELAEKVMEVMKREAMIERERRGDLT